MQYISKTDLVKLQTDKWKEYKNLFENGEEPQKKFAQHAMFAIRSLQKNTEEHFSKKKIF